MIGEYIKAASAKQFDWGTHDCSTFCADWRVSLGHDDPMADIRGRYCDEESGLGLIYEGGGLLKLWSDRMPEPDKNPIAGAVGVIDVCDNIIGIFAGERWIFLGESGIRGVRVPPSKILRVWNG